MTWYPRKAFAPRLEQPPWQWCAENIDYSRAMNYDTPYRGPFDPELMPFWKEPLEVCHDPNVRELVVLKCSRAGYSENLLLSDLRYTMACAPEPTLYVTGQMELAKGFHDRRVCRGMNLASVLRKKFKTARVVATDIQMPDMDFRATWASSDTATKQDGWARIHADEVSLWGEFTVDMVRRRCAAYPFHHIIFGGSIDPTRRGNPAEDPTLKLYEESDRRVWEMPDPVTGTWFTFSLSGVKWDQNAKTDDEWDLNAVAESAYFETPDGTRIDDTNRMEVVRAGRWRVTNPDGIRVGYKVVAPMIPFADCCFGEIARRFLSAKHRMNLTGKKEDRVRNTLRTYFAEMWGEAHQDEQMTVRDDTMEACEIDYELGAPYISTGCEHLIQMTCDVQKYHYWWLGRVWSFKPKTGAVSTSLLDFGNVASINDLDAKAGEIEGLALIGIDIGYALKATEVGEYCSRFTDQNNVEQSRVIALRGSDQIKRMPIEHQVRDAFEGGRSARRALFFELTWNVDVFRTVFMDCLNGESDLKWYVPNQHGDEHKWRRDYVRQVTSTKKIDGEWLPPGHGQDHLFDCEVMQMVLAQVAGLIK